MDYLQLSERVRKVQSTLNIYEIVSKHVTLREDGEFYIGKCPFHKDEGESFIVNAVEGKFYCYGCHAGGNALNFMARVNNISLMEAVELQAKKFGVELYPTKIDFDAERIVRSNRELTEINNYARDFYHEILTKADEGDACRKYLESRGITKKEIEKFQLGFAPNRDSDLATFLDDYDFKFYVTLQSGLVESTDEGFTDKFRGCITIPILNHVGDTAALIGRDLNFEKKKFYESEGDVAEYVYQRENPFFNRAQIIFGLNFARSAIVKSDSVIVVESCLDAIYLASVGVENVVAVFDKTLTVEQTEILTNFAKRITFCLKNGDAFTIDEGVLTSTAQNDGKIFIAALQENLYDFVSANGTENFFKTLENVVPVKNYKFAQINYGEMRALSFPAANLPVSAEISESPNVKKACAAILKMIAREIGLFRYAMSMLPPEVFPKTYQAALEYLQLCANENSPPDKEGAVLFFGGNVDEEFLNMLEDTKDFNELDRQAFEDGIDFLIQKVWNKQYSAGILKTLHKGEVDDKNLKTLVELTKQIT